MMWVVCASFHKVFVPQLYVKVQPGDLDGIRANERAKSAGTWQDDKALPNYDRYSQERELLKK